LITTLHADHLSLTSSGQVLDEGDLLDRLLRLGNGWWRIGGLQTGRSADVHGEVRFLLSHPAGLAVVRVG